MATITPVLRDYVSKDGTRQIVIRVEHNGQQRPIPVGHKVPESAWAGNHVKAKYSDAAIINNAIASKVADIRRYFVECELRGFPIHLDLICTGKTSYSFTEYLDHRAKQYSEKEMYIMQSKVERFAKELRLCFGRQQVFFEEMTPDALRDLETWLTAQNNVANTRHKKFKFLGEFYGHAMTEGKAQGPNHFKAHKITRKPVKKEKLTESELTAIEALALQPGPVNDARNLFLFSFYVKGSRFENCIMLKRADIREDRVFVRMNKGGKYVSVKMHDRLKKLLDQYPGGDFVFPFISKDMPNKKAYKKMIGSRNTIVNRNLKIVAGLTDPIITKDLTFHIARHTFADMLLKKSKKISVVQESLGHSDERTTRMYTNALGDEILDPEMDKLYGE